MAGRNDGGRLMVRAWRRALITALLALALAVGWYVASPWWTLRQLRAAADAGNAAALSSRIDFPAVRQSLKEEVKAGLSRRLAGDPDAARGMEGVGAAMAMAFVDPLIDRMVTPEAMAFVVRSGRMDGAAVPADGSAMHDVPEPVRRATKGVGTAQADDRGADDPEWRIARDGLSRFSVRGADDRDGTGPALVFERRGLGWRITGIDLPDDALTR